MCVKARSGWSSRALVHRPNIYDRTKASLSVLGWSRVESSSTILRFWPDCKCFVWAKREIVWRKKENENESQSVTIQRFYSLSDCIRIKVGDRQLVFHRTTDSWKGAKECVGQQTSDLLLSQVQTSIHILNQNGQWKWKETRQLESELGQFGQSFTQIKVSLFVAQSLFEHVFQIVEFTQIQSGVIVNWSNPLVDRSVRNRERPFDSSPLAALGSVETRQSISLLGRPFTTVTQLGHRKWRLRTLARIQRQFIQEHFVNAHLECQSKNKIKNYLNFWIQNVHEKSKKKKLN